jgi:hypothetical protein
MSHVMVCYRALEATCTGGYACFAIEHIAGCFTGEGDPDAVKGQYVAGLRQQLAGAVSALEAADRLAEAVLRWDSHVTLEGLTGEYRAASAERRQS